MDFALGGTSAETLIPATPDAQWRDGAELTDVELRALIDATNGVPQTAPGLLAWIDHACDWALYRRRGFDSELRPPEAATPPEEDAVSIDAAMAMRNTFARDSPGVFALFNADLRLLNGGGERRH